jgi:uncharacterized protein (DUF697 family)
MLKKIRNLLNKDQRSKQMQQRLDQLRQRVPAPVFWLFGKTQSGKTSIIKYLTGADAAEIGLGFKPCTRFSRLYQFPTSDAPLVSFLDTRGLDEPGYDSAEDLARFNSESHAVLVTAKVLDHAQENVRNHLRVIRSVQPNRPVLLVLTCLHEAYPQQQHLEPYPFDRPELLDHVSGALRRSIGEQSRQFAGLVDTVVPLDLTPVEEGFHEPHYGGPHLKAVLLEALPAAYRQTLATLEDAIKDLENRSARPALAHILGYSTLAATAGAISVPFVTLLVLPLIQKRMIYHLAEYFGQPLDADRFATMADAIGLRPAFRRQAVREATKFIPVVGQVMCSASAGASTYALGKAFCRYQQGAHEGKIPDSEELRRYYREQLAKAEKAWRGGTNNEEEDSVRSQS